MPRNSAFAKAFNTQIFKFFDEIIKMYPKIKEFKTLKMKIKTASLIKDNITIEMFHKTVVVHYLKEISEKDEKFFLTLDLSGTPLENLSHLRNLWKFASDTTKKSIWKYIELLTKLSNAYHK